jgi:hypothetical protein
MKANREWLGNRGVGGGVVVGAVGRAAKLASKERRPLQSTNHAAKRE